MSTTYARHAPARRRSRQEWLRLLLELRSSGIEPVQFAKQRGIAPRTLAWWRSQLRAELEVPRPVELVPRQADAAPVAAGAAGRVEIVLGEVTVVLHEPGPGVVAALIRELRSVC